jgi:hypothetical protein
MSTLLLFFSQIHKLSQIAMTYFHEIQINSSIPCSVAHPKFSGSLGGPRPRALAPCVARRWRHGALRPARRGGVPVAGAVEPGHSARGVPARRTDLCARGRVGPGPLVRRARAAGR